MRNGEGQSRIDDHPQPLLEKRRGDDSGPVDAFSRAIRDEKDPTIRGYFENLRAQIATIAAKYGANARDVFRADVQDRMETDDFARIAELVKAIGAFGKKQMDGSVRREILEGLEERGADATEVLQRVLNTPPVDSYVGEQIVELLLSAGMANRAMGLSDDYRDGISANVWTRIFIQMARKNLANGHPDIFRRYLQLIVEKANAFVIGFAERLDHFVEAFDGMASLGTDEDLAIWLDRVETYPLGSRTYAFDRLSAEYRRRGLTVPADRARELQDELEADNVSLGPSFDRLVLNIHLAKSRHRLGMEANSCLARALDDAEAVDVPEVTFMKIARAAGQVGAFDVIDDIERSASYRRFLVKALRVEFNVCLEAARGAAEAGDAAGAVRLFKRAMADRLRYPDTVFRWGFISITDALLNADAIDAVEDLRYVYKSTEPNMFASLPYVAARARRGAGVLADEQIKAWGLARDPNQRALVLANAAIATLMYVDAAKKRIAEYGVAR